MWKEIFYYNFDKSSYKRGVSHTQLPTVLITDDIVRVFFAVRDINQVSSVYALDLDINGTDCSVKKIYRSPCLTPGEIGFFDEHGVFPSSVIKINDVYYMYYIGWNKGDTPPLFYAAIGLAISRDGINFVKTSKAPLLSRSEYDPCLVTSPHVYEDEGVYRMTYVSGVKWTQEAHGLQSHYHIKHAVSNNGLDWSREGAVAIDFGDNETNIARSSVLKKNDKYEMWFSYVNSKIEKYRIGYATSIDGWDWLRKDEMSGIDVGGEYYKDMICYPCVFEYNGSQYMLFNGDEFGKYGFGLAVRQ